VFFSLTSASPYPAGVNRAAKEAAKELGWDLEIIENAFDPAAEDQQVQQYIASGAKPDAFLFWTVDPKSGINSTRQLSQIAPVIQFDQPVADGGEEYVTAFVGVNGVLSGQISGETLLQLRKDDRAAGRKLHNEDGNLLIFAFPSAIPVSAQRTEGFEEVAGSDPFNVLETVDTSYLTEEAYKTAASVIPKYLDDGIDYIWAFNGDQGAGVAQALRENGLEPGVDVKIVTGNCSGDTSLLKNGTFHAEGVESATMEALFAFNVLERFFETGKVEDGTYQAEATSDVPDLQGIPPKTLNYYPETMSVADDLDRKIWDITLETLCEF